MVVPAETALTVVFGCFFAVISGEVILTFFAVRVENCLLRYLWQPLPEEWPLFLLNTIETAGESNDNQGNARSGENRGKQVFNASQHEFKLDRIASWQCLGWDETCIAAQLRRDIRAAMMLMYKMVALTLQGQHEQAR